MKNKYFKELGLNKKNGVIFIRSIFKNGNDVYNIAYDYLKQFSPGLDGSHITCYLKTDKILIKSARCQRTVKIDDLMNFS